MFQILSQSFAFPIREYRAAVTIFWPLTAGYILLYLLARVFLNENTDFFSWFLLPLLSNGKGAVFTFFFASVIFLLLAYVILLAYGGIIKWHRMLLLNEEAAMINFVPGVRELKYFAYIFLFTVILVVILLVLRVMILGDFLYSGPQRNLNDPQVFSTFYTLQLLALASGYVLFLFLLANQFLRLPNVALERPRLQMNSVPETRRKSLFLPLLIMSIIIALIYATFNLLTSGQFIKNTPLLLVMDLIELCLDCYIALAGATLLSLFYKEYYYDK